MRNKSKVYRQGDVLITKIDSIPTGLVKTNTVTLALGEATGHHHSILDGNAVGYADSEKGLAEFLTVGGNKAALTHQEHDTINLPKGNYKVTGQVEYTPERLLRVAD